MGKKRIVLTLIVLVLFAALAINFAGCAKKTGPTNADIVKACIQRALTENCNIITPSISVVSKSISGDSSTIVVHYQCGGVANAGVQREMTLQLVPSKDAAGRTVWTAK